MRFVKTLPSPAAARKCRPRCEKTLPRTAGARKYSMPRHAMLNLAGTAALCAGPAALCAGRAPLSAAACGSLLSRPFSADVFATCALHRIPCCPACHPHQYMTNRVIRSVEGALRRLRLQKTQSILQYLGAETWDEVYVHFEQKRAAWNQRHPAAQMTLANSAIDHIRPVNAFRTGSAFEKGALCNHLSNLQPLLIQDNAWKGCIWSSVDEACWREHIIMNTYQSIYYPRARLPLSEIEHSSIDALD
jgi:hypothetical protein